jgi:hypothetical protein
VVPYPWRASVIDHLLGRCLPLRGVIHRETSQASSLGLATEAHGAARCNGPLSHELEGISGLRLAATCRSTETKSSEARICASGGNQIDLTVHSLREE